MTTYFVWVFLTQTHVNSISANISKCYMSTSNNMKFRSTYAQRVRFLFICSYVYLIWENMP